MAVDGGCNVYVAGIAQGTLPGQSPSGDVDAFVRKYDHQGNEMWTRQFGTSGGDAAYGLAVDRRGNVYVAGSVWGSLPGQISAGVYDAFLRKYDPQGNEVWTRQFGTSSGDDASGVAVDGAGNIYVAGGTVGSLPGQSSAGSVDVFLRKYDPQGNEVWTRQFGSPGNDGASCLAADPAGNIYLAGSVSKPIPGQTSVWRPHYFLRKYDPLGNEVWTRQFGSASYAAAHGVAVDGVGNVYEAGYLELLDSQWAGVFVRKYDPQGSEVWTRQFGPASSVTAHGVAVDGEGNVYVAGYLDLLDGRKAGGFVRKYDPDGTEVWTRLPGPSGDDHVQGVATDVEGNVYVAGSAFVTKLSGAPSTPTATPTPTPTSTPTATLAPTGTPDPSGLVFTITIVPSEPRVGDIVRVTAYASGPGGLPQYKLRIEPSGILSLQSPDAVTVDQLGVPVTWDLRAVQTGEATLQVWANYERQFCLPTHCFYQFTNAYADPVKVSVRERLVEFAKEPGTAKSWTRSRVASAWAPGRATKSSSGVQGACCIPAGDRNLRHATAVSLGAGDNCTAT